MHSYEFNAKISSDGTILVPEEITNIINHQVKVIMFDLNDMVLPQRRAVKGCLRHYADLSKILEEKDAMIIGLGHKHEVS